MANTSSAKKAQRVSLRRRIFNVRRKKTIHDTVKKLSEAKGASALAMLPDLYQALDKAAKHGTITRNKAARQKSRLTRRVAVASK